MSVESQLQTYAHLVDARLAELLPTPDSHPQELSEAIRYAALGPGKRLRPSLCLAACEACGGKDLAALDVACAVELIHCFSLVHDDLPSLDNDDLRRGRPTVHVQFTEAIAILAGDALFALAFESLGTANLPPDQIVSCLRILGRSLGMQGLVAGEAADILAEGKKIDRAELESIHHRKTAVLIGASCEMGAIAAGASVNEREQVREYGLAVGLAFQIADDVLNETGTPEQLGKAAGSDRHRAKATYPSLHGLERSKEMAQSQVDAALSHLEILPGPTEFLQGIAHYAIDRSK